MFKKKRKKLLESYKELKHEMLDFEKIKLYFNGCDDQNYFQVISDRTANDLDYEELFHFLDRTCSSIGQQYLYYSIRTIPQGSSRNTEIEKFVEFLKEDEDKKKSIVLELSRLNNSGAYYIQSLFNKAHIDRPKWLFVVPILSFLAISSLVLLFFYPPMLLVLIGVIFTNF
ncbi:MAG: DNA mismatch repair protein MutS, partial [Bacteroidota bacterium]